MATPLQQRLTASFSLLQHARDTLDDEAYQVYIAILLERVQTEAGRLLIAEADRVAREAAGQ